MSKDPCLKPFISYDRDGLGNSCWIDSLFVALFHNDNPYIEQFINNLKIKNYSDSQYSNISEEDKLQLEIYENTIIENINYMYRIINIQDDDETKKIEICYNMRKTLESHREILNNNNIFNEDNFFSFTGQNSSYELLQYLKKYVLDEQCFDNIELNEIIMFDNVSLNNELIKRQYKNINFINIKYGLNGENGKHSFFTNYNKINNNLFDLYLHSIIIHEGAHYTCYYKCNDKWYFYNDVIIDSKNRTKLIGTLDNVMQDHNRKFRSTGDESINLELTLLYLKNNSSRLSQAANLQQAARYQQDVDQISSQSIITEKQKQIQIEIDKQIAEQIKRDDIEKENERQELLLRNNKIREIEREKEIERQRQRQRQDEIDRQNEREKQKQIEIDKQIAEKIIRDDIEKEKENERLLQELLENERKNEIEIQFQRKKQIEREREREKEIERYRNRQNEREKQIEKNEKIQQRKIKLQEISIFENKIKEILQKNYPIERIEIIKKDSNKVLNKLKEELDILELELLMLI
jgi:hypothetical protein